MEEVGADNAKEFDEGAGEEVDMCACSKAFSRVRK